MASSRVRGAAASGAVRRVGRAADSRVARVERVSRERSREVGLGAARRPCVGEVIRVRYVSRFGLYRGQSRDNLGYRTHRIWEKPPLPIRYLWKPGQPLSVAWSRNETSGCRVLDARDIRSLQRQPVNQPCFFRRDVARARAVWSSSTLRMRTFSGVTSTHSSSRANSRHSSSVSWRDGVIDSNVSEVD